MHRLTEVYLYDFPIDYILPEVYNVDINKGSYKVKKENWRKRK